MLKNDPDEFLRTYFDGCALPVDVFHFKSKHKEEMSNVASTVIRTSGLNYEPKMASGASILLLQSKPTHGSVDFNQWCAKCRRIVMISFWTR
jgi:hypothetical protein